MGERRVNYQKSFLAKYQTGSLVKALRSSQCLGLELAQGSPTGGLLCRFWNILLAK